MGIHLTGIFDTPSRDEMRLEITSTKKKKRFLRHYAIKIQVV